MPEGRDLANPLTAGDCPGRLPGVGILRGLLGGRAGRRVDPVPAAPARQAGHRVYVERPPATVWEHLVSPAPTVELGLDCVRLLALPGQGADALPELVAVWRRANGRLWVGLSAVVEQVAGQRVVVRSSDGGEPLTLTTTLEPLDAGCVVSQQLCGSMRSDTAAFAMAWLTRGLLGLKADVEGVQRSSLRDTESDEIVERVMTSGVVGPAGVATVARGGAWAGVGTIAAPDFAPVSETTTIDVAVPPERLWEVLGAPSAEQLFKPDIEHVLRVELADEPGREHVVGVHRHDGGRRGATVSLVVEAVPPERIVERELTSPHESDVVTTIEACGDGSRLSETFSGWLPSGPGRVVDTSAIGGFMRTRLAIIKNLVEGHVRPRRDPRTGFLPPGQPALPTSRPVPSPSLPSSVVLPPPHVPDTGEAYDYGPRFFFGDAVFYLGEGVGQP